MKIELFSYDTRFFFTLLHIHDDRRRGGSVTNNYKQFKKILPVVSRRSPEAGFHRIHYDFLGSGVNHIDSCLFLQRNNT